MPYITTAERIGIEKGIEKGIQQGIQDAVVEVLETRFEAIPGSLVKRIKSVEEAKVLSSLHRKAILVNNLEEFEQVMNEILAR